LPSSIEKGVVWILSREFLVLTAAAAAVGLPLAYLANRQWLDFFYDRVSFGIGLLSVGGLLVLVLVLLTVGSQAMQAARVNLVRSLRYE
jgi:putative ABC transport system permease protein